MSRRYGRLVVLFTVAVLVAAACTGPFGPPPPHPVHPPCTGETVGTTDQRLILFKRDVPAGPLALGANASVPNKGNSTYITFTTPR